MATKDIGSKLDDATKWYRRQVRNSLRRMASDPHAEIAYLKQIAQYPHGLPEGVEMPAETSDREQPVSQRQLNDHKEADAIRREGDIALTKQQHREIREDIKEIKGIMEKVGGSMVDHIQSCPVAAQAKANQEDIKTLTWKFWLAVGTGALATGGGGVGILKLLT